jgi:two-component system OmpR family sensor kinase
MSAAPRSGPSLATMLARRLLVLAAIIFVVNSIAVGIYYGSDRRALEAEMVARSIDRLVSQLEGEVLPGDAPVRSLYRAHPDAYAFALTDGGGRVLDAMNSSLIPDGALNLSADDWITRAEQSDGIRIAAGSAVEKPEGVLRVVFVMAHDPARLVLRAYIAEFYEHVWLPILPLAIILIVANSVLIRRGLKPVSAAAAWARSLRTDAPSPPPATPLPEEIADLVNATQRAFGQLMDALEAEKRHAAEAAHALRTPLAVLVARVDALDRSAVTDKLRADLAALSRTVQQVLASSRADALARSGSADLDLRLPAEAVTSALAPFAYEHGVTLSLDIPDEAALANADREAVELALSNLVENAILHGGAGAVEITVRPDHAITVRDQGPGLGPDDVATIFAPFWRGAGAPPGGAGLGLAIVARVQKAQGGTVEARNAPAGGAEFTLRWPPRQS